MPELKVTQRHLERDAYLYVRQSTPRQVLENTESTQRQYALRDRALALGWPLERIHVIDCDLGKSGSQSAGRDGSPAQAPVLDSFGTELVRLVAGLILSTRQEDFPHAGTESYPAAS